MTTPPTEGHDMTLTEAVIYPAVVAISRSHCVAEVIGGVICPIPHQHAVIEVPTLGQGLPDDIFLIPTDLLRIRGEVVLN